MVKRAQDLRRLTLKDNCITNMSANLGKMYKLTELYLQRNEVGMHATYVYTSRP
jgi:hypothetical protein